MRRLLAIAFPIALIVSIVSVGLLGAWLFKPDATPHKVVFSEYAVSVTLEQMRRMSLHEAVAERIVRETIRHGLSTYSARAAVLDYHLCPAFGMTYWEKGSVCYDVIYASNTSAPERWLDDPKLLSVVGIVRMFRETATEKARKYLRDPQRLEKLFETWENVVVDELQKVSPVDRAFMIGQIEAFVGYVNNPEVKIAQQNYLTELENYLHPSQDAAQTPLERETTPYQRYEAAFKDFAVLVGGNTDVIGFAARREAEGGSKIVAAYMRIASKVKAHLEEMNK